MKYFTKELWKRINTNDVYVRNNALKEWEMRTEEYLTAFNTIKEKFPKSFLKVYDQNECLHDYVIERITFNLRRNKYNCKLHLAHGNNDVIILLSDVRMLSLDFSSLSLQNCIGGKMSWGYAEFDYLSDNVFTISILCDFENEMMFGAKRIAIKHKKHGFFPRSGILSKGMVLFDTF